MEGKKPKDSSLTLVHQMSQQDANLSGNVHGGVVMKHIDTAAGIVAARHACRNVVTASIERLDFHSPVFIGDLLTVKASLNLVGRTSLEVGVRVEAENFMTAEIRHTASAYLTFVALDQGHPTEVPPLILETEEERRRHREALARREMRQVEKQREKKSQG